MGYDVFCRKSIPQLEKHIRLLARDTASIVILPHAKVRMRTRKVTVHEVYEVLRQGCMHRPPEPNPAKGSLECRMERYVAGRNCAVVVALGDANPNLLIVTVWV